MNDELLFERLASHDGPAALDSAFEGRLYSILEREMRRGRSLRTVLLLAATLMLVLIITAAIAVGSGLIKPPWLNRWLVPTPSPSIEWSTSPPVVLKDGPLQAGTYVAHPFPAPADSVSFTFNVPDGWVGTFPGSVAPTAGTEGPSGAGLDFLQVTGLYDDDKCTATFAGIGPSVDDLASGLEGIYGVEQSYEVTTPADVTLSGYSGKRMDVLMPSHIADSSCRNGGYPFGDGASYARGDGNRWHLWILEVAWERVVILAHDFASTSPKDQAELLAIVDSIRIEPPSARGWPGSRENPAGQYSWFHPSVGRQGWMHNGNQALGEGHGVEITFADSGDAAEDGPTAVTIAGHPGTFQELISADGTRTRRWIVEFEGTRVIITMTSEPNTTAAQLAEVDAIIDSIRYEPMEADAFRLTFTLPAGWDSG